MNSHLHPARAFCNAAASVSFALIAATAGQNASASDRPTGADAWPSPDGALSPAQVAACSEEVRRSRAAWKYWPGDARAAIARLGAYQKQLFEGRCAGHPQAQAYVMNANKLLAHGAPAGVAPSGSLVVSLPPPGPGASPANR
jgi:hypothetical protein